MGWKLQDDNGFLSGSVGRLPTFCCEKCWSGKDSPILNKKVRIFGLENALYNGIEGVVRHKMQCVKNPKFKIDGRTQEHEAILQNHDPDQWFVGIDKKHYSFLKEKNDDFLPFIAVPLANLKILGTEL